MPRGGQYDKINIIFLSVGAVVKYKFAALDSRFRLIVISHLKNKSGNWSNTHLVDNLLSFQLFPDGTLKDNLASTSGCCSSVHNLQIKTVINYEKSEKKNIFSYSGGSNTEHLITESI